MPKPWNKSVATNEFASYGLFIIGNFTKHKLTQNKFMMLRP